MTNTAVMWIVVALIAAAVVLVAAIAFRRRVRLRSAALLRRFGPEYDRAVQECGSPMRAERELAARARRIDHIQLRELNQADRARFASTWSRIQGQFVDDPRGAVMGANELIKEVMRARGYPADDFEHRVADFSVEHANVVQHYRAARARPSRVATGRPRRRNCGRPSCTTASCWPISCESPERLRNRYAKFTRSRGRGAGAGRRFERTYPCPGATVCAMSRKATSGRKRPSTTGFDIALR